MPFISLNKKVDTSYYHYHKNFSDENLQSLSDEIGDIDGKEEIKEEEKKLISLINHRLNRYKT